MNIVQSMKLLLLRKHSFIVFDRCMYLWAVFYLFIDLTYDFILSFCVSLHDLSAPCLLHPVSIQSLKPSSVLVLATFLEMFFSLYLAPQVNNFLNFIIFNDLEITGFSMLVVFDFKIRVFASAWQNRIILKKCFNIQTVNKFIEIICFGPFGITERVCNSTFIKFNINM